MSLSELEEIANEFGIWWPGAHQGELRRAASAWRDLGRTIDSVGRELDGAAGDIYRDNEGPSVDAFEAYWSRKWLNGNAYLPKSSEYCYELAASLEQFALEVDNAVRQLEHIVEKVAVVLGIGIAGMILTAGLTGAAAAAEVAVAADEASVLAEFLATAAGQVIAKVALFSLLEWDGQVLDSEIDNPGAQIQVDWGNAKLDAAIGILLPGLDDVTQGAIEFGIEDAGDIAALFADPAIPDPGDAPDISDIPQPDFDPNGFAPVGGTTPPFLGDGGGGGIPVPVPIPVPAPVPMPAPGGSTPLPGPVPIPSPPPVVPIVPVGPVPTPTPPVGVPTPPVVVPVVPVVPVPAPTPTPIPPSVPTPIPPEPRVPIVPVGPVPTPTPPVGRPGHGHGHGHGHRVRPNEPISTPSSGPVRRPKSPVDKSGGDGVVIENPSGPITINVGAGATPGGAGGGGVAVGHGGAPIAVAPVAPAPVPTPGGGAGGLHVGSPSLPDVKPIPVGAAQAGAPVHIAPAAGAHMHEPGLHQASVRGGAADTGHGSGSTSGSTMIPPMMGMGAAGAVGAGRGGAPVRIAARAKRRIQLPIDEI